MRGGILIKALAFACLAKADRDEYDDSLDDEKDQSDPLVDPNFYIDQLKGQGYKSITYIAEQYLIYLRNRSC